VGGTYGNEITVKEFKDTIFELSDESKSASLFFVLCLDKFSSQQKLYEQYYQVEEFRSDKKFIEAEKQKLICTHQTTKNVYELIIQSETNSFEMFINGEKYEGLEH
jgi:hypothetical protein